MYKRPAYILSHQGRVILYYRNTMNTMLSLLLSPSICNCVPKKSCKARYLLETFKLHFHFQNTHITFLYHLLYTYVCTNHNKWRQVVLRTVRVWLQEDSKKSKCCPCNRINACCKSCICCKSERACFNCLPLKRSCCSNSNSNSNSVLAKRELETVRSCNSQSVASLS